VSVSVSLGRVWSPEQDAGLRAGVEAGRSLPVLAERYDCTPEQIAARIEALGIALPV